MSNETFADTIKELEEYIDQINEKRSDVNARVFKLIYKIILEQKVFSLEAKREAIRIIAERYRHAGEQVHDKLITIIEQDDILSDDTSTLFFDALGHTAPNACDLTDALAPILFGESMH